MMYTTIVAASILATSAVAELYQSTPQSVKLMFEAFKADHSVTYQTMEEESNRYGIFLQNLRTIDERNAAERAAGGSAVHGITRFSDLTATEFKNRYLRYEPTDMIEGPITEVPEYTGTAGLVDWTGKYTTPVKDQGYCGSCWAFAAAEQIESDSMRLLGDSTRLSPQQLVSCDKVDGGCAGGRQESAYGYVQRAGGIEKESDYPYSSNTYNGNDGTCTASSNKYYTTVTGYNTVKGENSMASYVRSTGPLSIGVDATNWNSYQGGIMSSCGKSLNHAVQAVGVDTSSGGYWKVRNSWSSSFGEAGFIRLAYGQDTCGLADAGATYVSPKRV
jgi:C1A family cysteine protease